MSSKTGFGSHLLEKVFPNILGMKFSKLEYILIIIPSVAFSALLVFLYSGLIPMETFWNNLTYFLLAGIFIPLATLVTLQLSHQHSNEKAESLPKREYNYKKLNDEVFRKLINILCLEHSFYFGSEFGFCISSKPIELNIWKFFEFHSKSSIESMRSKEFEEEFKPINEAIPNLLIGEKYLEKNYTDVFKQWLDTKLELEKINKERQQFLKKVSLRIKKNLKKEFKTEPLLFLSPHGNDWAYFEDNIVLALPVFFRIMTIRELDIDNEVDNQSYVVFERLRLLGFNKLPDKAIETIKFVINSVISDIKLETENGEFYVRLYTLNTKLVSFSKEIEIKVVNDIDNMI